MTTKNGSRSTRTERRASIGTLTLLQQNQHNHADRTEQMKNNYDCFQHFSVSCGATDRTELIRIQRGSTYKPPIDIRHTE